jgi:hypothetical protein
MCHSILQKHIKRQIISLPGGFQLIADLNAYHRFLGSLRTSQVTAELAHLKMLAHVYVVEDATDLAQIVRDVTRYGGAYRPEVRSVCARPAARLMTRAGHLRIHPTPLGLEENREDS